MCARLYFSTFRFAQKNHISFCKSDTFRFAGLKLWAKKNIQAFRSKLAEAIELLLEKKVILQYEDDGLPVYKLSVDLFRRWWGQHHNDLTREIDTIL